MASFFKSLLCLLASTTVVAFTMRHGKFFALCSRQAITSMPYTVFFVSAPRMSMARNLYTFEKSSAMFKEAKVRLFWDVLCARTLTQNFHTNIQH